MILFFLATILMIIVIVFLSYFLAKLIIELLNIRNTEKRTVFIILLTLIISEIVFLNLNKFF